MKFAGKQLTQKDRNNLKYLTTTNGLPSNRITKIIGDKSGNWWFNCGNNKVYYEIANEQNRQTTYRIV